MYMYVVYSMDVQRCYTNAINKVCIQSMWPNETCKGNGIETCADVCVYVCVCVRIS